MKILQIISYGYVAGGAEKSVLLLKQHLQQHGHEVKVISSNHNTPGANEHFSDIEFPEIDDEQTSLVTKAMQHLWYVPSYRVIRAAIAAFKPDVVHFHVMGQLSPSAIFACKDVPSVLTVHGPEEYVRSILEWSLPEHLFKDKQVTLSATTLLGRAYYSYFGYIQRPIYTRSFKKHLKAMIAPSKYMAGVLAKEQYSIPIHHIYNGIELPRHYPIVHTRRLLYVGRLEHVKGVDTLLKAMPAIARLLPDIHLSVVGDGTARPELEAFVDKHGLRQHVTFHGWLDPQAVNRQYRQTTAVIIPSIWPENLPTVCIEALAVGRPVIGSDTGGIPELIRDGVTGLIVPKGNVRALAAAVTKLLLHSDLSQTAVACTISMQAFRVTTFVQNLEQTYRQIIRTEEI